MSLAPSRPRAHIPDPSPPERRASSATLIMTCPPRRRQARGDVVATRRVQGAVRDRRRSRIGGSPTSTASATARRSDRAATQVSPWLAPGAPRSRTARSRSFAVRATRESAAAACRAAPPGAPGRLRGTSASSARTEPPGDPATSSRPRRSRIGDAQQPSARGPRSRGPGRRAGRPTWQIARRARPSCSFSRRFRTGPYDALVGRRGACRTPARRARRPRRP